MAIRRERIDRRLSAAAPIVLDQPADTIVVFRDGWGEVTKRYDLGRLGLPSDITMLLADAFRHHHAASSRDTQRHCWMALRAFARFVSEDGLVVSVDDLTSAMVGRYIAWLDRQVAGQTNQPWSKGSRANVLMQLRQMIDWTKRRHPSRLPSRIDFPWRVWPNRSADPRARLGGDDLKAILRACYEEIDEAWDRFEAGRTILATSGPVDGVDPELCDMVRALARVNDGVLPSRTLALRSQVSISAVNRHGGLRHLGGYLHLTGETVVAFFIAIAIQTAGNPDALRMMARDCQVAHPLDEHRVIVEWAKPRAGAKVKRAQRRSFDCRRRHAAPNLIDRLLAMTAPLVSRSSRQDRNRLFLVKSEKKDAVTLIAEATLSHALKPFIKRSNARIAIWNRAAPERARQLLPDFAAILLRGSVATEYYKASGGDIVATQDVLNHARVDTTELYIKGPQTRRIQRETIARSQALMLGWIVGAKADGEDQAQRDRIALASDATVPFSHDCLNPATGIAPGSAAGRICRHFGGCLRCPGLVIPIDADHMARVLQAKEELERARERIDPRRFELLYVPSLRILTENILPDFPERLREEAERRMSTLPTLPALE
ncbi:hypothetical protein [Mesorhizobium sp. L-2-11]|uniref:hypothetical protein n=1 Tax=Mesorhizobium sp. L-2-11 TaxID=2744521 RepID=UPI0018ED8530|nr:hypothetical protein [Mesorhizobium sp. L-2-11]BCH19560.1 hypothetical protein MesoLjLa_64110 [Mesorhizobium sp. L-2-11]BCH19761.1 hypothetical protein MesoLjLa_66120 [Mesorhizobium sp. L-2-11]